MQVRSVYKITLSVSSPLVGHLIALLRSLPEVTASSTALNNLFILQSTTLQSKL